MAEVRAFCGYRFSEGQVGSLDHVITPPYDVISEEMRQELIASSPYNMARLLLPEEREGMTRYEAAARDLEDWIAQGILRQEVEESFYLLEQGFYSPDGKEHIRRGFFAITKIPENDDRAVLGHERTFDALVEDRLFLTQATRANLGAVFVLYADPNNELKPFLDQMSERPASLFARTCDQVNQQVWRVPYDEAVTEFFRDKKLYIADGHHRFETARIYRDQMRAQKKVDRPAPYDYVLMGFVSFEDPALRLRPPHRLLDPPEGFKIKPFLKSLERWFEVEPVKRDLAERLEAASGCAFGIAVQGAGYYLIKLRDIDRTELLGKDRSPAWRDLDVAVLHRGVFQEILGLASDTRFTYEPDTQKALETVKRGEHRIAFLLNPTPPEQIRACAEAGDPMPQKSTYFFPKFPSGAVIYRLA